MSQTTEKAFETYVEEVLLTQSGWKPGSHAEWDRERALFPAQVFAFIADTQHGRATSSPPRIPHLRITPPITKCVEPRQDAPPRQRRKSRL